MLVNTPFWIAHIILWIAMLVGNVSKLYEPLIKHDYSKVINKYCGYVEAGCIGAMIMYTIVELI